MKKTFLLLVLLVSAVGAAVPGAQGPAETRLLRFPAIHGNQVVFTYAGDLYTVPAAGGVARRLTSDIGFEMFARFSPDGKTLAFTGQYDGNTEVYVMPAIGGVPKRVTWTATLGRDDVSDRMGPNNLVMGWKNDSQILFRSRRTEWNDFRGQLYLASVAGGPLEELPLPRGGFGSFSADGKQFVYNRVFREFRTWKRYRGGQADDVWLHDFTTKTTTNLTNNPAQDIIPMWKGNKVYFASDRDDRGRMNLYSYDLGTKQTKRLTNFTEFDVKFPSLGDTALVFENGGWIYKLDLATDKAEKIPVTIAEDFDSGRGALVDVSRSVTNFEIAPDGSRALFGARGDVFTVPAKSGPTRNLTATPGVHERDSKWSPDGRWVSYISDASGEDEIWIAPQDGRGAAIQVTTGGANYKYQPIWSPDSRKLMWSDRNQRLHYVDIGTKAAVQVAESKSFEITTYAWSPDSRWIAYAKPEVRAQQRVYLYSLETKAAIPVTDTWYNATEPAFSPDGKLLFFVSARTFNPTYGQTEFQHIYSDMSRIYFVTLTKDTKSPFAPKSDEVKIKEEPKPAQPDVKAAPEARAAAPAQAAAPKAVDQKPAEAKPAEPKKADGPAPVKVDPDGLIDRIGVLPTPAGNYRALTPVANRLYYVRAGTREPAALYVYDLDKQAETQIGTGGGYEISADGKKMIVSQPGNRYAIIDTPMGKAEPRDFLNLADMKVALDRHAEWKQMFHESWRQMRDFFYAPNMHGVDWPGLRKTYEQLLPYVNHRADLTYVIGEMISELNAGHAYVGGGEMPRPERVPMGLLGARLSRDPQSKFFRIDKIFKGQNWDPALRSPLTEIGVDAKAGDYIVEVDGRSTAQLTDIWEALVGKAGRQVTLKLNATPAAQGARETVVVPVEDERQLYYFDWVQANIAAVDKATNGRVGYIHIPDMGVPGLNEFAKYYYPQTGKDAMIVDVRSNGGGNVSPMIIERLRRELVLVDIARNGSPQTNPGAMILGPKVLLADEFSASDGDLVTYRFKTYKMGPVVGKRTWGGVVGIRGALPMLDGGVLNRPEFSRYDVAGKTWAIEGVGVEPDIVVDNDPAKEYAGEDQQLDRAIKEILDLLKKQPAQLAPMPPYPVKGGEKGWGARVSPPPAPHAPNVRLKPDATKATPHAKLSALATFVSIIIPSITFLLLVAVGLDLTRADFEPVWRRPALVLAGLAGPLLILPALSLALVAAFDPPPAVTAGMLLIAACPIGGISNTYSYLARASAALSVTLTALSCLVAVGTIPLLTRIFEAAVGRPLGFEAPIGTLLAQLSAMLVAPIATGMYIRARWPVAAAAHRPAVQRAAFSGLALLVVVVVWAQFDAFRHGLAATVPLAAVFVVSAFGVGWAVGLVFAHDRRDHFTLAMEFATRNVAIATAIAVSILGRVDFAVFATTYFLTELPLALAAVAVFRRTTARAA